MMTPDIHACRRALVPNLDGMCIREAIFWRTSSEEERKSWHQTLLDIWGLPEL